MQSTQCCVCQNHKAPLKCGICAGSLCKSCAQFIPEDQFSFLPTIPPKLKHTTFCGPCFDSEVAPEIASYEETMEKARNLTIFYNTDSKLTRNFKRTEKPVKVSKCTDREETLLRLAFLAVMGNFNALLDVEVIPEKIRSGTYQTTIYSGSAIPTNITSPRIHR